MNASQLLSQLRERCFDPRKDRTLSELGKNPACLSQMLNREHVVRLTPISMLWIG
jgi:hypothetical protein